MLRLITTAFAGSLLLPLAAFAHHSVSAWFDREQITELEGELTELFWQNPHIRFTLKVSGEDGQEGLWDMESLSVSGTSRTGLRPDLFVLGDRLRVAGNPSRRNLNNVFVRNVLLPSGEEIVLGGEPRWSEKTLRGSEVLTARDGVGTDPARGIFRVWSTGSGTSMIFPENIDPDFDFSRYPLTAAARSALDAFDYFEDDPTIDCVPKGMPLIMEQPYPMQFVEQGDDIVLRLEEYDTVRTIHMNPGADAPQRPASPLGYSIGRWESRNLVVTTTNVNSGYFDSVGIPLSEAVVIVERFMPSADGARLDYQMTVTDPATFTEPVELEKYWIWLPDVQVRPYQCRQ